MIQIDPNCKNCNKTGLAILPVRYAVAPKTLNAKLPAALKAPHIKQVPLQHHQYALRVLRQGFLYVFYEKRWVNDPLADWYGNVIRAYEVYSVDEQGLLWRQPHAMAVQPTEQPVCGNTSHYVPAALVAIANPEKAGTVWLAFSEHIWSPETLQEFGNNAKARAQRMQKIAPAALIDKADHEDGFEATEQSLQDIVEYKSTEPAAIMSGAASSLSKPDGSYDPALLKSVSTNYPVKMRSPQKAKETVEHMKVIGQRPGKPPCTPVVLALWDAVGIAHELNGFRNEASGRIEQYGKERELEITALNAIEGVKKTLKQKAGESADALIQHMQSAPRDQDLDNRATRARLIYKDDPAKQQAELQAIDQERARRAAARQKGADKFKNDQIAGAWPKYEAKLDGSHKTFKQKYDAFLDAAAVTVDNRTNDLLAWLEAQAFIDELTEYHQQSIFDGVAFEEKVGKAIFGISSSQKGAQKLDEWIKEAKATKKNLVWRTIALNQEQGIAAVNAALVAAASQTAPIGRLSLDFLTIHVRKCADIYKKANTMQNTVAKARNASEGIKMVQTVERVDYLFLTLGDRLFRPFIQRGVDSAAEYAVRGLMLARAGVEPDRIIAALEVQAKEEGLARAAVVRRLQAAKTFIGSGEDFKDLKHAELQKKWQDLKALPDKGPTALKENRLSLLVATLEIINLAKIGWDLGNDKAKLGELVAAAASTSAAVMDIAANAAKHLVGDKVSVTFQMLKVSGGILSAGAGYYATMQEWNKAAANWDKDRYAISIAYYSKAATQFAATTLGLLSSISYAAPILGASSSKTAQWVGGRLLFYRLFCMTWAVRLNMVGIAITIFIWLFTDDELQNWCEESPFGINKSKGNKDANAQLNALSEALKAVY